MLRKILLGFVAVVVLLSVGTYGTYLVWRAAAFDDLENGSELAATEAGPIEYALTGDSEPVVLFLHGSPGGYDQALPNWEGFRLLAPSRPGYLGTPLEVGRTPEEQASSYIHLLDELAIEEVVVLGASGGGPSAVHFAAAYPERTTALILLEAVTQTLPNDGGISTLNRSDFLYWATMTSLLALQGPEGLSGMLIPDLTNRQRVLDSPAKLERLETVVWTQWPGSLRTSGWENDLSQMNDLALPAERVTAPTLLIHGTADAAVPLSHSEELAARLPDARLQRIEGADHLMPLTHFEEISEISLSFLSRVMDQEQNRGISRP